MNMNSRRILLRNLDFAPYNPRLDLKPGGPAYKNLKRSIIEIGLVEAQRTEFVESTVPSWTFLACAYQHFYLGD